MTFTYTPSTPTDLTRVRFALGDTESTTAKLSDEEIDFMISEQGTWQRATLACIRNLMAKLADPNFTADWLTVDNASAFKSMQALLASKQGEFGIGAVVATTGFAWRPDSGQTAAPTFEAEEDDE